MPCGSILVNIMIYSVKARFIEEKMGEFYRKLTDGTIQNQKPDGQEIVNSVKRAKITESNNLPKRFFLEYAVWK